MHTIALEEETIITLNQFNTKCCYSLSVHISLWNELLDSNPQNYQVLKNQTEIADSTCVRMELTPMIHPSKQRYIALFAHEIVACCLNYRLSILVPPCKFHTRKTVNQSTHNLPPFLFQLTSCKGNLKVRLYQSIQAAIIIKMSHQQQG